MVESEVDEYNLNIKEKKQTLKISLINNQQIAMVLINNETRQTYLALVTLPQLKKLCNGFTSTKTIKDALTVIKQAIESGKIILEIDLKGSSIVINYKVLLQSKEYSLNIHLLLQTPLNRNRSNSATGSSSIYSTRTAQSLTSNSIMDGNQLTNSQRYPIQNNKNINQVNNAMNNKIVSDYSTMTVQNRPFVIPNLNYGAQGPNPTLMGGNLNIVEKRPRMINMNSNLNQKDVNRSSSTPSHPNSNFNQKPNNNIYQPNLTNNPFQVNLYNNQNQMNNVNKFPFDRNTEKPIIKNSYGLNKDPQDKTNSNKISKTQTKNQLQKNSKIPKKKVTKNQKNKNGKNQQLKQQIKQTQSYTNKRINNKQQFEHQTSHDMNPVKTQLFSQPHNSQFRTKISTPMPGQIPTLDQRQNQYNDRQISQQQIALAQLASMQNQENPNLKSIEAITLDDPNLKSLFPMAVSHNEQIQEMEVQQNYEEEEERNVEEEEIQEKDNEEQNLSMNIEALFITEEGRVIFRNGLLRGIIHRYAEIDDVVSKIQDILLKGVKFHLVYKAFDLDDKAKTFHEKCDNLIMSLVLIETDKDVRFGGFTTKSWKGNCLKKKDNSAFVFSLETNKIYDIIENEPAVGCYPKFGPVFFGCQIRIYDEFFTKGGSTCHRGLNYKTRKDFELNNGEQKYLVKDIEVYKIEPIDIV